MTRPIDQADVDAVLERTTSTPVADIHPIRLFSLRSEAVAILNAAVALGWTPPARKTEARYFWRTRGGSFSSNDYQTAQQFAETFVQAFPAGTAEVVDERTVAIGRKGRKDKTIVEGRDDL